MLQSDQESGGPMKGSWPPVETPLRTRRTRVKINEGYLLGDKAKCCMLHVKVDKSIDTSHTENANAQG